MSYMLDKDGVALFKVTRPTKQILRLNAFMSLAMRQIDQIRVKYRPNGFICSLPRGWWILRLVRSLHAYQDGQPINSRHRSSAHTRNAVRSAVAGPPAASVRSRHEIIADSRNLGQGCETRKSVWIWGRSLGYDRGLAEAIATVLSELQQCFRRLPTPRRLP